MEKIVREIKLARGILIHKENVLLVQDIRPGQGHYFLPGGNVEPGESVKEALPREWQEELGWEIKTGTFLGCLENKWDFKRKQDSAVVEVFEVNFLFLIEVSKETLDSELVSKESHLKFSWVPIKALSSLNLLPGPLKSILPDIANAQPNAVWASTI